MEIVIHFKDLIYLSSHLIGVLISALLIYIGIKNYPPNILLGLSFASLTYGAFIAWLIFSGLYVHFPALYRTGNIGGLLFPPFFYLYIRSVLYPQSESWKDLLFFFPLLLYIIDYFPVLFLISLVEKKNLILQEIHDPVLFTSFNQAWFLPKNFHTLFRTLVILFFWVLSFRLLYLKKKENGFQKFEKPWFNWMIIYLVFNSLLIFPFLLSNFFSYQSIQYDFAHLTGAILLLVSASTILFFPQVLYGTNQFEYIRKVQDEMTDDGKSYEEKIPPEKYLHIEQKLKEALEGKKVYVQKGYSLADLAKETKIPAYQLTYHINRNLNSTFYDLINYQRIEETCRIIESGKYKHLTLEALSEKSGFNNRNSFSVAFKKFKGIKPSEYLKNQDAKHLEVKNE